MLINKIKKVIPLHWLPCMQIIICLLILTLSSLLIDPGTQRSLKTPDRVGADQVAEHVGEEEEPQRTRGLHVHRKPDV